MNAVLNATGCGGLACLRGLGLEELKTASCRGGCQGWRGGRVWTGRRVAGDPTVVMMRDGGLRVMCR